MSKPFIILSLSTMLLASAAAPADDAMTIRIYNDDADDIVLSVYDMNAQPPGALIANQRINGFAWIPIAVSAGAVGKGHLKWMARTVDSRFYQCGHQEVHGVAKDALVYVSARSTCPQAVR